jgi:hypothetical protein
MAGKSREDLRRRKRNVEEEADRARYVELPEIGGEGNELIIVHPDRVVGLKQRRHLLRETLVDAEVDGFGAGAEVGDVKPVVEEGPQAAVGKAEIIAFVLLRRQGNSYGLDFSGATGLWRLEMGVGGYVPAPPEP